MTSRYRPEDSPARRASARRSPARSRWPGRPRSSERLTRICGSDEQPRREALGNLQFFHLFFQIKARFIVRSFSPDRFSDRGHRPAATRRNGRSAVRRRRPARGLRSRLRPSLPKASARARPRAKCPRSQRPAARSLPAASVPESTGIPRPPAQGADFGRRIAERTEAGGIVGLPVAAPGDLLERLGRRTDNRSFADDTASLGRRISPCPRCTPSAPISAESSGASLTISRAPHARHSASNSRPRPTIRPAGIILHAKLHPAPAAGAETLRQQTCSRPI